MKHKRNTGPSQLGLNNAGKGSADRSPGWRRNYGDIFWSGVAGFCLIGRRQVKTYGAPANNQLTLKLNEPQD